MNAKELAEKLNGRNAGDEITKEEAEQAMINNLVVIYGASDDLIEIDGIINDEVCIYGGGDVLFLDGDLLRPECDDDCCPHEEKRAERAVSIKAKFDNTGWSFDCPFECSTFDIFEDGEIFCKGIVFDRSDLVAQQER